MKNAPNTQQLTALLEILEQETRELESAQTQLTLKQQALVNGQPKQLATIDKELVNIGKKTNALAKQRDTLAAQMGWQKQPLKAIIAQLPPQFTPRFTQVKEQLKRLALDVDRLNKENQDLLALSLNWTKETIEVIRTALNPDAASYNAQGEKRLKGTDTQPNTTQSTICRSA